MMFNLTMNNLEKLPKDETLRLRRKHIGGSLSLFYKENPIKIVRGDGQYMYDEQGNRYLDCINNVAHVGHSNEHVLKACLDQMSQLCTNTRYLHDNLVIYAKRLTDYFPNKLSVCYFVNSGSEANDLALRLARNYTGNKDVITLDSAYHGHLTSIIDISPYKFDKMTSIKQKKWAHVAPLPCSYRGLYTRDKFNETEIGQLYAQEVKKLINNATNNNRRIAAFIAESMVSCGGQVVLPPGYLRAVYSFIRQAGGVCIADEVQVGFGRIGTSMWAFQHQGDDICPDIVTLGKPIGNGHPVACVVTTPEIAKSFENIGTEYFNTYGGNPVSLAVASAVLDEIENRDLMTHAKVIGNYMINKLKEMKDNYYIIGDIRGVGLFFGVELVKNRLTKEPASELAYYIVNRFRENNIIMSTEGKYSNVLKFKPPMLFDLDNANYWLKTFEKILKEIDANDRCLTRLNSLSSTSSSISTSSDSKSVTNSSDHDSIPSSSESGEDY